MKNRFSLGLGKKLLEMIGILLFVGAIFFTCTTSQASAVSISDCNTTNNVSACKNAFKKCQNPPTHETSTECEENYLITVAPAGAKPPAESGCNNTANPSACKTAYEKCGNNNDKSTIACKQKAIDDQAIKQIHNPGQNNVNPAAAGCKGNGSQCGSTCGSGNDAYTPVIDIGCKGEGNPIADALFAIIRVLSDGVGLVVIGSIIVGGIQYSASRGDPQATAMAINRIRSSLMALLIFIFAYALLNYIIPGKVLQ